MMKRIIFTLSLLLSGLALSAQIKISGTIQDTLQRPLTGATVMLMQAKDSLLSGFALANERGTFEISGVKPGDYFVQISFLGYRTVKKPVAASTGQDLSLGALTLIPQTSLLDEVTVSGEREPMKLRKDTVEFNAAAFQTAPNSTVEDLIKKLPGVDVDKDGAIKAQGENVTRVLVNGKEFFGRDPKTATRNLPADAVDKVQVFDKLSDQAEFSGVDDGQREKTINITLRPDRQNGTFGTMSFGAGGPEQFDGRASINRFKKNEQLSFIGMANNINRQGFTISEFSDFIGGLSGGGGGGFRRAATGGGGTADFDGIPVDFGRNYGFTTTFAGGLNFNHEFSKKTQLNGSYAFNAFDKDTERRRFTQNIITGASFTQADSTTQEDRNANHRLNFTLDTKLDTTQSIRATGRVSLSDNTRDYISTSSSVDANGNPRNTSDQLNNSEGNSVNLNTSILYRKRFARAGRNFNTTFTFGIVNNHTDGVNQSTNLFVQPGSQTSQQVLNQINNSINDRTTFDARLSYTEPIRRGHYLEVNYRYNTSANDNNREVYDLQPNNELVFSPEFSNEYRYAFNYHRVGANYRIAGPKVNFSVGLNLQQAQLNGELILQETTINRSFTNVLPTLRMRYSLSQSKNLVFDYDTDITEPSITQLQPVPNITNPLYIYQGNPNLKPEYGHRFNLRYLNFNQFNFSNLFAFVNFNYTRNRIQNTQTINEQLVTVSSPVNVPDDYRVISRFNYSGRIKPIKMRFSFDAGLNYTRSINFINDARNIANTTTPNTGLRLENQTKKIWDWSIGTRINYSNVNNSVNTAQNQDFYTYEHTAELRIPFAKQKFNLSTDLNFQQYRGLGEDFNQDIPLWGASFSWFFLKGNKGQLKFAAVDLLNQNQGISRQFNLNSIVDEDVTSLARYYLISFTYALKGFAATNNSSPMRMFR